MTKTERLIEIVRAAPSTTGQLVAATGLDSGTVSALMAARRRAGEVEKVGDAWRYVRPPVQREAKRRGRGAALNLHGGVDHGRVSTLDLPRAFAGSGAVTQAQHPIREGADDYRAIPSRFGSTLIPYGQ